MSTVEKRFKKHKQDAKRECCKNRPLYRAMNKYGVENFIVEEIDSCEDDIQGCELEKYWIGYYDTYHNGYNATYGGDGRPHLDYDLIFKTYQKLQSCKDVANKLHCDADMVSKIVKDKGGIVKTSQEIVKDKYSKKIDMYSLNGEYIRSFDSTTSAALYIQSLDPIKRTNICGIRAHISDVAKGRRLTAYKFKWKFKESI